MAGMSSGEKGSKISKALECLSRERGVLSFFGFYIRKKGREFVSSYGNLAESSVDAVLVSSDNKVNSSVGFLCLLHREPNVVVEDLFDGALAVGDFAGSFEPLN